MWLLFIVVLLSGCQSIPISFGQTIIEWVDFIKWNGKEYEGIYTAVLADETFIGEKVGEVQFKVADNVKNPSYRTKDGDAAFHEAGTELYSIKGREDIIAVKSDYAINGYEIYYSRDDTEYKWHFKDLPAEKVERIEIYQNGNDLLTELSEKEDVQGFLILLQNSEESLTYNPNMNNGDPIIYDMIFYTDEPIAYSYTLFYDGVTYYWHPWNTSILSEEMNGYLEAGQ